MTQTRFNSNALHDCRKSLKKRYLKAHPQKFRRIEAMPIIGRRLGDHLRHAIIVQPLKPQALGGDHRIVAGMKDVREAQHRCV